MTLQSVKEVIASVAHCFPWVLESYRLTQLSRQLSATSSVPRVFSSSSHHTRQRRRCAREMETAPPRDAGAVCVSACSAARRATSASRSMSRAVARRLNCFDDREATLGIWERSRRRALRPSCSAWPPRVAAAELPSVRPGTEDNSRELGYCIAQYRTDRIRCSIGYNLQTGNVLCA